MDCNLLEKDIGACEEKTHKGYKSVAYWTSLSNIDFSTLERDGSLVDFALKSGSFKRIYDSSNEPFAGSYPTTEVSRWTYFNEVFSFPVKAITPESSDLIAKIKDGVPMVVILEQFQDGKEQFVVMGLDGGLRATPETILNLSEEDKVFDIVMECKRVEYPVSFFFKTNTALTRSYLDEMSVDVDFFTSTLFEKGVDVGEFFNFGETLSILPINATDQDIKYEVVKRLKGDDGWSDAISVDDNGIISVVNDEGFEVAVVRASVSGKSTDILIVNNAYYGVFRIEKGTDEDLTVGFTGGSVYLFKPSGDIAKLTNYVPEPCGAGYCYLIYESDVSVLALNGQNIIGAIRTNYAASLDISGSQISIVKTPNAMESICYDTNVYLLVATNALYIDVANSSLSARAIAILLNDLVTHGQNNGYLNVLNNAPIGTWSDQAIADKDILLDRGWTVVYSE